MQHVLQNLNEMIEIDPKCHANIDAENYYRLILIIRSIAVTRPQNLVKFADAHTSIQDIVLDDPLGKNIAVIFSKYETLKFLSCFRNETIVS